MIPLTQQNDWLPVWEAAYRKEHTDLPFYTPKWHDLWQQKLGEQETRVVITNEQHTVIIPLALHGTTAHFSGGEEIADYLDAIGEDAQKPNLWHDTLSHLKSNHIHSLFLRNIPETSSTLTFFKTVQGSEITQEDVTPIAPLPKTLPEYLGQLDRKDRHEYKRKVRKFEEAYPGALFDVHPCTEEDMRTLLALMKGREDKTEFLTKEMEQFFLSLPQAFPDTLTTATLTHMHTPIAALIAFENRTNNSLLLYNSGYRSDFVGSGYYLKAKMIEWAIGSSHAWYNFLQGNERYKYELGGIDHPVYRVTVTL